MGSLQRFNNLSSHHSVVSWRFYDRRKTGSYNTRSTDKTFAVHFSRGISIHARLLYTATAKITTEKSSFAHTSGMSSASCSGVTVTFKSSSKDGNSSRVFQGQIPALIFHSSSC